MRHSEITEIEMIYYEKENIFFNDRMYVRFYNNNKRIQLRDFIYLRLDTLKNIKEYITIYSRKIVKRLFNIIEENDFQCELYITPNYPDYVFGLISHKYNVLKLVNNGMVTNMLYDIFLSLVQTQKENGKEDY